MAKIRVDNIEAIKTLRDIVRSDDLFPYADYDVNDPDVVISITLYKKDPENPNLKYASREYNEIHDGRMLLPIRTAVFQELYKINPDEELVKKLETLGITLEIPKSKGNWF